MKPTEKEIFEIKPCGYCKYKKTKWFYHGGLGWDVVGQYCMHPKIDHNFKYEMDPFSGKIHKNYKVSYTAYIRTHPSKCNNGTWFEPKEKISRLKFKLLS